MQIYCLQLAAFVLASFTFTSAQQLEAAGKPSPNDPHSKVDFRKHPWVAPGPGDSRGPCPGMNTLANHGFLPHTGRNITITQMVQASNDVFNVHRDIVLTFCKLSLMASNNDDTIDALENIALHGNIEHDASLSREDFYVGDHIHFNEKIFTVLANSNPGVDYYNITSATTVLDIRTDQSRRDNPKFRNTIKEFQIRAGESIFYLSTMGDPISGIAPKKFVNVLFREQRLPLEEGWRVPKNQMTPHTLNELKKILKNQTTWHQDGDKWAWVVLSQGAPEDPQSEGEIFAGNQL